jgi:hypothetical protein
MYFIWFDNSDLNESGEVVILSSLGILLVTFFIPYFQGKKRP